MAVTLRRGWPGSCRWPSGVKGADTSHRFSMRPPFVPDWCAGGRRRGVVAEDSSPDASGGSFGPVMSQSGTVEMNSRSSARTGSPQVAQATYGWIGWPGGRHGIRTDHRSI